MSRLFLKIYLGIALVLVVGTLGTLFLISRGLEDARFRGFEDRLIDSAEYVRDRVETDDLFEDEEELFQLSRASGMVFKILEQGSDLPLLVADHFAGSEEPCMYREDDRNPKVFAKFSDGRVLEGRFGRRWGKRRRGEERPGQPRERRPPGFWGGPESGPPSGTFPGPGPGDRRTRNLFLLSVIGIPLLLVGPAIYFLIRPMDRRIYALSAVAEKFGDGDLESRADTAEGDALGELSGTFNHMADQIKGLIDDQNELLQAVSHELRTPLARLFFIVDDAEAARTKEEKDVQLARIQKSLTEMNDLVDELLTYVRLDREGHESGRRPVSVKQVFSEMSDLAHDLRADVKVEIAGDDELVQAIPRLFKRAVQNLFTNAVRHAGSTVFLNSYIDEHYACIVVEDDGPGVPEDKRLRILEPFIRVDESRNSRIGGVGLGLAIVSRVVALHDGDVHVSERQGGGARFLLRFPLR